MKKRLFCVLLAVSMIGSSLTVHAAETDDRLIEVSSVREGQADVTGEIQKPDENEGEETVPEGDAISEAEPEMTPETDPSDVPGEEQPEVTPVSEPTEIPGEEPVETPEEIPSELPTETPSEEPEEIVEVTPTGIPTEEPEATPVIEPEEIPEGSPSPDMLVTPGIMSFSEDGIGVIMEDEGLLGATPAPATWTGYLQEDKAWRNTGTATYAAIFVDGDSGGEAGINSGVELGLNGIRLRVRDALFNCYGTIYNYGKNSAIYLENPNKPFSLMKEGKLQVQANMVLRIQIANANLGGTIELAEGATLIVEKNAEFNGATINLGKNAKLAVIGSASFDNVTIKTNGTGSVVQIQDNCTSFENVTVTGSYIPTLRFFKNANFGGQINVYRGTKITVGGDVQFGAGTVINATGTGSTVSTVAVEGNCTNMENIALKGKGIAVTINGDADIKGPVVLESSGHKLTVQKNVRFYPGSSVSGNGSVMAGDHTEYIADGTSDFLVDVTLDVGTGLTVSGKGAVFLSGAGNIEADSCEVSGAALKIDGDFNFFFSNIAVNTDGGLEIGTPEKDIGSFPQGEVNMKISGGTARITGDYDISNGNVLDINTNGVLNVDGKFDLSSGTVTVSSGARLETGMSEKSGSFTQNGGKLEISGGTVQVADNFFLSNSEADVKIDLGGILKVGGKLDFPQGSMLMGADSKLETGISGEIGDLVFGKGDLQIKGGMVKIGGNFLMEEEVTTRDADEEMTAGNILISDGGSLEVGTSAKPGNLTQKQGDIQITGGTVSVAGDYLLTGDAAADINADSTFTVGGKTELTSGSIAVGEGSRLETGTAQKPGNLSHGKGTLNINGGTVHVTGNHNMSAGSVLDLGAGSTLEVDGDFVRNSGKSCSYTEGTIKAGNNVELKDSFSGTGNFRLVMNGKDGQKIISEKSGNKLNLQLEGRNVTTVGDFGATVYSGGTITPDKGTFAATSLKVEECGLKVNGNVEATGRVEVGGKSGSLEVTGNYIQPSDSLKLSGGEVIIGGDYRIQKKAGEGYGAGTGGLIMDNPNPKEPSTSKLTVNGNLYMESPNVSRNSFWGTMTVKGNIEQKKAGGFDKFEGYKDFRLVLAGDGPQTVSLESEGNVLNELELINDKVTIKGYLNAKLAADGSITLPSDGTLEITGLELQGYELTVKGGKDSVVKASGNVDLGGASGHLVIPGDYVQSSGALRIGEGTMEVGNDLLVLDRDNDGKDKTGEGYLSMTGSKGELIVQGDLTVQSRRNSTFSSGTLMLSGDLVQRKGEDGRGTGYINATSTSHKVILAGEGSQNIVFDNEKNKLGTLQLTKDKSEYGFDPDKISMKVTTGPAPEPPSRPLPSGWPFSDVPVASGNWRYDSVKFVYDNGVMNGISGTDRFAPDEPLTRGMFATVLYRIAGEPDVDFENRFSDVSDGRYYSKAVIWAYSRGIVQGIGGGKLFGTEEYITREQIAKMLYEFGRVQGYAMDESADLGEFPDNGDVSDWAVDYMKWAVGSGMINGKNIDGSHYLDPKGNATRVECAAMLTRFMKKYL